MKKTKRLFASALAAIMVATSMVVPVFADNAAEDTKTTAATSEVFPDVAKDAVYVTSVETLNLMGIIKGYEDGTFGPLQNVTRAEFTAMLMRTLNYGSLGSSSAAALPFTDVDDNNSDINWAIPNINTAYDMGIINGYEDGTFRPNDNVAYEEALKMIVCTLGYTDISVDSTPWYSLYLSQAKKLGITDVADGLGSAGTPASRACIAQMLYDSLEAEIVEQGNVTKKTILTDYLGYVKSTGVVSSDGVTSLSEPDADLRDDEVQINGQEPDGSYATYTYKTTDSKLKNYLGYEIEYYYKDNGASLRTLAVYVLRQNNTLTLTADMIEDGASTNNQIRYYKSDADKNTVSVSLASDNVVIYNGKLYGLNGTNSAFSLDMIPKVGTITLLDSDSDGKYEIVKIESYEIYYVSSKVSAEYSIIDDVTRSGNDKKLILDVNDNAIDTRIVNTSGNEINYSAIATGNIICLAKSNPANGGKQVQTAVVVNDSVTGTVTAVEPGKSMTIAGTKYEYSKAAPWISGANTNLTEPQLQDSGTYCKDINGDIVAYKKNAVTENVYYGYIMGIADAKGAFDDEKSVRILTQSGSEIEAILQKNVRVDNNACTVSEAMTALQNAARNQKEADAVGATVHQTIKYTTKTSGGKTVLDKIYTATGADNGAEVVSNAITYYTPSNGQTMKYDSTAKQLKVGNVSVNIGSATIFVVPNNRGEYKNYKKAGLSATFKNGQSYTVDLFDVSKTNAAKVVVCYGGNASSDVDSLSAVNVLSEDPESRTNTDNGDTMNYLTGYKASYSSAKGTLGTWLSDETEYIPQLGDIFRAGTDRDGFAVAKNRDLLYRVGGNNQFGILKGASNFYQDECAIMLGSVIATDDNSISILPQRLAEGDIIDSTSEAMNFTFSQFSGARVLQYDDAGRELVINDVSDDYEGVLKGLAGYNEGLSNPDKVLLYMHKGSVKLLCVLDSEA